MSDLVIQPDVIMLDGSRTEIIDASDGVYIRPPDDAPLATNWHGPYPDQSSALSDCRQRRAKPALTAAELQNKKDHGYYSIVNGIPMVLHHCAWTGATILTSFDLVSPS